MSTVYRMRKYLHETQAKVMAIKQAMITQVLKAFKIEHLRMDLKRLVMVTRSSLQRYLSSAQLFKIKALFTLMKFV